MFISEETTFSSSGASVAIAVDGTSKNYGREKEDG